MRRTKTIKTRVSALILVMVMAVSLLSGCGKGQNENETTGEKIAGGTVATDLYLVFLDEIKGNADLIQVADKILESEHFHDISTGSMAVEEGYLNGFDAEIKGFQKGVMFAPMIGSMPFVGYIFETDDPDTLVQTLKDHAQLNWNICTVADEMLVEKYENYVFFVMAPTSFDE